MKETIAVLEGLAKDFEFDKDCDDCNVCDTHKSILKAVSILKRVGDVEGMYKCIQLNSGEASPSSPFGWRKHIATALKKWLEEGDNA